MLFCCCGKCVIHHVAFGGGVARIFPKHDPDIVDVQFIYTPIELEKLYNEGKIKILSEANAAQCRVDPYLQSDFLSEFIQNGGIYLINKEWDNCLTSQQERYRPSEGCFPKNRKTFDDQMSRIQCSITSGPLSTATVQYSYPKSPEAVNFNIFKNVGTITTQAASTHFLGGTPLLIGNTSSAAEYCSNLNGSLIKPKVNIPTNTNVTVCAAEKLGNGLVIAFADSNIQLPKEFYENLCAYRHNAGDLLSTVDNDNESGSESNPLP